MPSKYSFLGGNSGLTLLELIVTLTVVGILLTIAVPNLNALLQGQATATTADRFALMLAYARQEAVTRCRRVVLCPSVDGETCVTGSGRWEEGWIVFIDEDEDFIRSSEEELLRVGNPGSAATTLRTSANFRDGLAYLPLGNSRGQTGLATGTFRVCDSRGADSGISLIIARGGRVRRDRGTSQCP